MEWIDYADCQGQTSTQDMHTSPYVTCTLVFTGLQFHFQLDTACHTLCQLTKDEIKNNETRMRRESKL